MKIISVKTGDFGAYITFAGSKHVGIYKKGNDVTFENIARNKAQTYLNQAYSLPEVKRALV